MSAEVFVTLVGHVDLWGEKNGTWDIVRDVSWLGFVYVCVYMPTHACGNQRGLYSLYLGCLTEGTQAWWVPHSAEPSPQSHLVIGAASGRHLALGRPEEKLASSPIVRWPSVRFYF